MAAINVRRVIEWVFMVAFWRIDVVKRSTAGAADHSSLTGSKVVLGVGCYPGSQESLFAVHSVRLWLGENSVNPRFLACAAQKKRIHDRKGQSELGGRIYSRTLEGGRGQILQRLLPFSKCAH